MDWRVLGSSFFSFLFTLIHATSNKLSTEKCIELGLSANLLCSSCDALKQFKLGALVENCQSCCHADGDDGSTAKVTCLLSGQKLNLLLCEMMLHS